MSTARAGIATLAFALVVPACSSSSGADAQFVGKLTSQGIPGDRGVEIAAAHQICDAIRPIVDARKQHVQMQDMMPMIVENGQKMKAVREKLTNQEGLTIDQYGHLVAASAETYCPDLKDSMTSTENQK
jgi:hypothetical protein